LSEAAQEKLIIPPCNHAFFRNRLAPDGGGELTFAHLGGVPVEETLGALAPVALAVATAMRMTVHRLRQSTRRSRTGR
jgi:hypothetical protein